jgi:hypothetical protein
MMIKTIEERSTHVVHASGAEDGRTLCDRLIRTVSVTRERPAADVSCPDCRRRLDRTRAIA